MAPIRRYLRISKYSVLECRIFLSDPADEAWLESRFKEAPSAVNEEEQHNTASARRPPPRTMMQRIFETIRPLVLPKLREEHLRRYGPGNAKKSAPVKDVLVDDDFEASIFLRENNSSHSLLRRDKTLLSTSQEDERVSSPVRVRNEEDDDDLVTLRSIPLFRDENKGPAEPGRSGRKRRKRSSTGDDDDDYGDNGNNDDARNDQGQDAAQGVEKPSSSSKRLRMARQQEKSLEPKPLFHASYNGFRIGGWTLCLLITRRRPSHERKASPSGQILMEEWISSQLPREIEDE